MRHLGAGAVPNQIAIISILPTEEGQPHSSLLRQAVGYLRPGASTLDSKKGRSFGESSGTAPPDIIGPGTDELGASEYRCGLTGAQGGRQVPQDGGGRSRAGQRALSSRRRETRLAGTEMDLASPMREGR